MNRLTRCATQLNLTESHRFIVTATVKPHRRRLNYALTFKPHRHFSAPFDFGIFFSQNSDRPRRLPRLPQVMDPVPPESDSPAVEDFVHIEDPNIESLCESIVSTTDEQINDEAASVISPEAEEGLAEQRRVLPEELSRSVLVLTCETTGEGGICDVYLVGTAHVSQESCREVQAVISYLKPQVVFLELCASRVAVLTPQNLKVPTMGEMVEMWKKKHNIFGILYSWFLAKVANKLEVFPGSEFRVAYEEAMKYRGKVILGDRPVQITIRRAWAKMPLWHKIKLLYSFVFQAFFLPSPEELTKMLKDMDDVDMLTLIIQEMSKEFPTLMDTLVHERDRYMSTTLLGVAKEHQSVVAVVGKGHLSGIKKNWQQPVTLEDLLEMPTQKGVPVVKIFSSIGVAVAGVAIISGVYLACKK
ncbi:traB domain-containing protein [Cucumis sativus]|uniref:TraB family protein n=1 Tax=Cucumis sativus TaxID=3659 RepID=A0A0A0LTA7_CUCSA|nr:traB domain-containing protein [Cucumis sativus]